MLTLWSWIVQIGDLFCPCLGLLMFSHCLVRTVTTQSHCQSGWRFINVGWQFYARRSFWASIYYRVPSTGIISPKPQGNWYQQHLIQL